MLRIVQEALTFDDVLLVPGHSTILPRETNLSTKLTKNLSLNIPLLSSAMDTVTNSTLAIAIASEGGVGVIHKNSSIEEQTDEVKLVKKYESGVIQDPITVSPNMSIGDVLEITRVNNISGVPVVVDVLVDAAGGSEGLDEMVHSAGGATSGWHFSSIGGGKSHAI